METSYSAKRNERVDVGRDKSSLHTPERELEVRALIWYRGTKVGGNICAMLRRSTLYWYLYDEPVYASAIH